MNQKSIANCDTSTFEVNAFNPLKLKIPNEKYEKENHSSSNDFRTHHNALNKSEDLHQLTIDDLVVLLKVKVSWIRYQISRKQIPYYKLGRHVRFNRQEIAKWLEAKSLNPIMKDIRF